MTPLIKKLRDATGPDREIDLAVWEAVGRCAHRNCSVEYVQSDSDWTCDDCGADTNGLNNRVPSISFSLDAALALAGEVLPGREFAIYSATRKAPGKARFVILPPTPTEKPTIADHKSLVIAALIAILQAQGETE